MNPRGNIPTRRRGIPAFSVLLIMAALAVIGAALLPRLNVQYTPSTPQRTISVSFSWPDASARLVEQHVTSRIEGALSTVSGNTGISSTSSKGAGYISLSFAEGTDMAAARFEVATAIRNLYARLPEGVSYPAISLATSGGSRRADILIYTIKADLPSEQIERFITAHITMPLTQIEGVEKVSLSGTTPYEWVIRFDPYALQHAGLAADDLATAFNDYFRNDIIGLTLQPDETGTPQSIVLRLRNRATLDFDRIPVATRHGRIYRLGDFASVRWQEQLPASYFRINGLNTVNLAVSAETHTNMLEVARRVKAEMTRLGEQFPAEISATLTYDATEYVSAELRKIYLRTLLCVAILLLFVYAVSRDMRYLLIIFGTLVVNILVAVVFYNLLQLDIHIYTLAGITVSLGILIDTSIIMVDHYSYYRDRRVFTSILGALLTTIGALAIVWLLPEQQRLNLTDFALVVVINLTVSLIVALLFIPALLDRFPLGRGMTYTPLRKRRRIVRLTDRYGRFIAWGRRHRWIFLLALVWGFGIPTFLLPDKIEPPKKARTEQQAPAGSRPQEEELPRLARWYNHVMQSGFMSRNRQTIDRLLGSSLYRFRTATSRYNSFREPARKTLYVQAGMAEGCTVQQLNEVVRQMENYISSFDEVESFRTNIYSYDNAQILITFKPEYENSPVPLMLKQELTAAATHFGGATWRIYGIDDNFFNNNVVSSYRANTIRLQGYNYDRLTAYAEALLDTLAANRRVAQPEIMDGSAWSLPHTEFHIRYDEERIAAAGLDVADYYALLHTMLYRSSLSPVYNDNEMQAVVLESADRDRFDRWHITNAQVRIDSLQTKLAAVGSIEKQRSGISIRRENQSYSILVGFDFIGSYELSRRLIERTLKQFNEEVLPIGFTADSPTYQFAFGKKNEQVWLILLVVAIIYTMCAILFESLLKPLVIILMIPISFIGVFLVFGWTDFVFDQGGFAAFVLLCGIVVNAGIYLINEAQNLRTATRKRGIALYLKAYNHKIVPIWLTILSTVLGLVPFLYDGPSEVFWFAFAMAAIAGTLFSMVALVVYLPLFLPLKESAAERETPPPRIPMKHAGTLLKYAGLLLWAACFWMLFDASLDMPAQELREQALTSLQAVLLLLILAAAACCTAPLHFKLHTTDLGIFLLWGLMTAYRYGSTNPATWVRYDELLPAVLLYVAVRIFTATDRRAIPVLLTLLSLFGILEAWTGLRQIYGFTYSNHGLFRITGSLFNPGPYAGFITPILVCAAAFLVRTRQTAERLRKANTLKQRLRSLLPNRLIRMVIPRLMCWGAVLAILIVLPATMSRAAGVAAAVAGAVFVLKELGAGSRLRNLAAKYPLRFGITTAAAMLLVAGAAFGAYWIKRPSAEGRLLIWKMDTRIILRHPLCGVGPGNFAGAFGAEQARYFSEKERPELEKQVAGCPESGFNEFLQFGAETGIPGLLLLLLTVGSALHSSLRRGNPLGYGLLAATLFACFSYPWSVLPLRLLFVVLLAAALPNRTTATAHPRRQLRYRLPLLGLLAAGIACWPGIYNRTKARITARRAWNDTRIWINSGRCDYLVEDGGKLYDRLCYDFRFLYDYGYALHKNGNFRQSNEILAQGATMSSDPMFWNIMGKNFEALGDHARAEDAFMQAHLRIPDRIYPLYLLARHYRDLDRREQAVALARKIVAHKPKIESQQTRNLQTEMQRLIDSLTHAPDPKP